MNLALVILLILFLTACEEAPQWHKQVMSYHKACKEHGGLQTIFRVAYNRDALTENSHLKIRCKDGTEKTFLR